MSDKTERLKQRYCTHMPRCASNLALLACREDEDESDMEFVEDLGEDDEEWEDIDNKANRTPRLLRRCNEKI